MKLERLAVRIRVEVLSHEHSYSGPDKIAASDIQINVPSSDNVSRTLSQQARTAVNHTRDQWEEIYQQHLEEQEAKAQADD